MQTEARTAGRVDTVSHIVQVAVLRPSEQLTIASDQIGGFFRGIFDGPRLRREVQRLRALEQSAVLYEARVADLVDQVDRLRSLQNLPPIGGRTYVDALVIGYFPHEHRITLNVGERDGVLANHAVVTGEGLLAIVQTVEPDRCQARLLSSPQVRVGGVVLGENLVEGLVVGDGPDILLMEVSDRAMNASINDEVVTSGYSEFIPRGIPIGRVVQIEESQEFGLRRVRIFPHVRARGMREVRVVR